MSLALAAEMDLGAAAVVLDERRDYGEVRYRAFGRINGAPYCLPLTFRPGVVRVISLRPAREKKMRRYGA